jgi:hypothetical protein
VETWLNNMDPNKWLTNQHTLLRTLKNKRNEINDEKTVDKLFNESYARDAFWELFGIETRSTSALLNGKTLGT